MAPPILSLTHVGKSFGATRALVDASLDLHPGEVTALVGENGAGKSTLVKILGGVYRADRGAIHAAGQLAKIHSPRDARRLGISIVHQESVIFDNLCVAENILIGERPQRRGLLDWNAQRQRAAALLRELEAPFDPDRLAGELSVAQKHLLQIARGLAADARIVVLDEPTAALSHRETADLFRIIRQLQQRGCAILFISHRFEEIFAVANRYAVFRDGSSVASGEISQVSPAELVRLMVGRDLDPGPAQSDCVPRGKEVLRVEQFSRLQEFTDVSFSVHAGEILGVYGLVGAGRSELMQCLFGLTQPDGGRAFIDGKELRIANPAAAMRAGLAYVPEDRREQALILPLPLIANIAINRLAELAPRGLIRAARERSLAEHWIGALHIRTAGPQQSVGDLSGGNQQKVALAKWLATGPRVLVLDEPTKGIDVAAKQAVHAITREYVRRGLAVILVSSDLPEITALSDRVLVMRRGRVRALFERAEATPERIVKAATDA